ncbi:hypothetical protein [Brachybacterium sp. GPGPB12]|uniref:variant leucine-rich repeat-containing protein n=1 Tax=Brachybacterium sp. GPGPB12 TaxID=3023517 RepID=UPI0031345208
MAEHRSTAEEAADPGTSPERLLELTEKHPQLHRLIVMNPSAPEVARQWILATNQWAKQAYEAGTEQSDEDDDLDEGEPTQPHQVVPDEEPEPADPEQTAVQESQSAEERPASASQPGLDDDASAWDEVPEALVWGTAAGATGAAAAGAAGAGAAGADASADERPGTTPPPAPPAREAHVGGPAPAARPSPSAQPAAEGSSSVRLSPKASVVPLGAAPAAQTSPTSQTSPAPRPGSPTRQMPAVAASAAAGAAASSHPTDRQSPYGQQQYPYGEQGPASPGPASQGPASAPPPVGRPPQEEHDSDDGDRKRALIACGGRLVLALILLARDRAGCPRPVRPRRGGVPARQLDDQRRGRSGGDHRGDDRGDHRGSRLPRP